jgi:hypothetical protein
LQCPVDRCRGPLGVVIVAEPVSVSNHVRRWKCPRMASDQSRVSASSSRCSSRNMADVLREVAGARSPPGR